MFDFHLGHRVVSLSMTHSLARELVQAQQVGAPLNMPEKIYDFDVKPQSKQGILLLKLV